MAKRPVFQEFIGKVKECSEKIPSRAERPTGVETDPCPLPLHSDPPPTLGIGSGNQPVCQRRPVFTLPTRFELGSSKRKSTA